MNVEMIWKLDEIVNNVSKSAVTRIMVVANPAEDNVLAAVKEATKSSLILPILIGDADEIKTLAREIKFDITDIELIDIKDEIEICRRTVKEVSEGRADIIMKGLVSTKTLLREILDKDYGLRTNSIISHIGIADFKDRDKLVFITDAAMNISPSAEDKIKILGNAVGFVKKLGIDNPNVACIAAVESVSEKMPATTDAKYIIENYSNFGFDECVIEGPVSIDIAVSGWAAKVKGYKGNIVGTADILLAPNIEAGNILYKLPPLLKNTKVAGLLLGAKCPIVMTSRSDTAESKMHSIALAATIA